MAWKVIYMAWNISGAPAARPRAAAGAGRSDT